MRSALAALIFLSCTAQAYSVFQLPNGHVNSWNTRLAQTGFIAWKIRDGAPPMVRESVLYCLQEWSDASYGHLKFQEGDGGIEILWDTSGASDLSPYLGFATFRADSDANLVTALIRINASGWAWSRDDPTGGMNLDSVMMHELGHALGLGHPIPDEIVGDYGPGNYPTMWPFVFIGARTLHEDDVAGIRALYPSDIVPKDPAPVITVQAPRRANFLKVRMSLKFSVDIPYATTWDFGDGTVLTAEPSTTVKHRWKKPGQYIVTATTNGKSSQRVIDIFKRRPRG